MSIVVVDLGFGDAGKGSMTDRLCREPGVSLVVRYNGGPQASHHVVLPDGTWHGFAQFGSGTFAGIPTYLSRFMLVEPYALQNEAHALTCRGIRNPFDMLTVDENCLVITPWHWQMNRFKEARRGHKKHGSCGMGVGEARADEVAGLDVIRVRDLGNKPLLQLIHDRKIEEAKSEFGLEFIFADKPEDVAHDHERIRKNMRLVSSAPTGHTNVVFEGAQGVLLDEKYGWLPYNTWTNTMSDNALTLTDEMGLEKPEVLGLVSALFTRHGEGPFPSFMRTVKDETHNRENPWQGPMRHGLLDVPAIRYAMRHCEVDSLALTQLDKAGGFPFYVCFGYLYKGKEGLETWYDIPDGATAEDLYRVESVFRAEVGTCDELGQLLYDKRISWISKGPTMLDKTRV